MKSRRALPIIAMLAIGSSCLADLKLAAGDKKPFLVIMVDTKQSKFKEATETVSSWIFPPTTKHYTMQVAVSM